MFRSVRHLSVLAVAVVVVGLVAGWSTFGTGFNRTVLAIETYSIYGYTVVGGEFTEAGGQSAKHLAFWDFFENKWKEFGEGTNGPVRAMTIFNGDLIIAGDFTRAGNVSANGIARWDGIRWRKLGEGVNGRIRALVISDSSLYVGGEFTRAGSVNAKNVARWTGTSWQSMGGGLNGPVHALESYDGDVFAGGDFTRSGNRRVSGIARWNGGSWRSLASDSSSPEGVNANVYALTVWEDMLIVGGDFTEAGGTNAGRIASWDGDRWSALGSGLNGTVFALNPYALDRYLQVGGSFTRAGGETAKRYAIWVGEPNLWWGDATLGAGMNGPVHAIGPDVGGYSNMIGGDFTVAGSHSARRIAMPD